MILRMLLLCIQNTIHSTLLFVLLHFTVEMFMSAHYTYDLIGKEVCLNIGILSIMSSSSTAANLEVTFWLAKDSAKDILDRSPPDNVKAFE